MMSKRSILLTAAASAIAVAAFGAPLLTAPPAQARTPYDGAWSVLIVTDAGTCDRAYRYALRIENGRVYYDDPSFNVAGRVDGRGRVSVSVSAGGQQAHGSGRLSANYGDGRWSGRSSTSQCSGHWEASRRG